MWPAHVSKLGFLIIPIPYIHPRYYKQCMYYSGIIIYILDTIIIISMKQSNSMLAPFGTTLPNMCVNFMHSYNNIIVAVDRYTKEAIAIACSAL